MDVDGNGAPPGKERLMAKNAMGKSRPTDRPYLIYSGNGFEYRVLKAYSADPHKRGARWFLATKSPYTFGSFELGDGYIADVAGNGFGARLTYRDPEVPDDMIPDPARVPDSPMAGW